VLAIYGHMNYMAPYVMLLIPANPLRGQVGWGLGPGSRDFFGPCELDRASKEVPIWTLPLALLMDMPA
jgi:hypothetical protein